MTTIFLRDLTERQRDALEECRRTRGPYWWREASMKSLAEMGLAEAWHPSGKQRKRMAYRLTSQALDLLEKGWVE